MIVACPKCTTAQDVGDNISPEGTRVVCSQCGVKFVVRRAATAAMGAGARYHVRRSTGNSFGPFTEVVIATMIAQGKLDGSEAVSIDGKTWSPIASVPSLADALNRAGAARATPSLFGGGDDLPAPREAVPRSDDLPAPRGERPGGTIPFGDLPAPRGAVPRPDNLPAPAAAVPAAVPRTPTLTRPDNLPAPVGGVPRIGNLPAPAGAIPRLPTLAPTDNLPAPVGTLPRFGDLPAPVGAVPSLGDLPAPVGTVPRLDDLPAPVGPTAVLGGAGRDAVTPDLPPLDFGDFAPDGLGGPLDPGAGSPDLVAPVGGTARTAAPGGPGLDLPIPKKPTISAPGAPPPAPLFAEPPGDLGATDAPLDFGADLAMEGEATQHADQPADLGLSFDLPSLKEEPAGSGLDLGLELGPSARLSLDLPSVKDEPEPPPLSGLGLSFDGGGGAPLDDRSSTNLDLGLSLDGASAPDPYAPTTPGESPGASPFAPEDEGGEPSPLGEPPEEAPAAEPAVEGAPAKGGKGDKRTRRKKRSGGAPGRVLVLASVIVLVGGGAAAALLLDLPTKLLSGPPPEVLLQSVRADLDRDHFPAYDQAAKILEKQSLAKPKNVRVRAAGANVLLDAAAGRGAEASYITRAEALLAGIPGDAKPDPAVNRARAMVAVAKASWKQADALLMGDMGDAALVRGWRLLNEGKGKEAAAALAPAKGTAAGAYAWARAQELAGATGVSAAYKEVLSKNSGHLGAAVGLLRVANAKPETRLAKAKEIAASPTMFGSAVEKAQAFALIADLSNTVGKVADAAEAYTKALELDPKNQPANLARGTALLAEGKFADALARFSALGPGGGSSLDGKFGLAGALIGTGKAPEGLTLLKDTMTKAEKDARGPYWLGRAAEMAQPPDLEGAGKAYTEALALDAKFLPASLQLAALRVRQDRAADALAVLKAAEDAGSAKETLAVAWGQALLAAHDPVRAKEAYKKALDINPKMEAARLGMATAYEMGGELEPARTELEKLVADSPGTAGLRPRLAEVLYKLGKKEDALTAYLAEIDKKQATMPQRVKAGMLAIELKKPDVAKKLADRVLAEDVKVEGGVFLLALALRDAGGVAISLPEFKRALTFDDRPVIHLEYALTLERANRADEALEQYKLASALPQANVELGRMLLGLNNAPAAIKALETAVKLNPALAPGWFHLGRAQARGGDAIKARVAFLNALKLDPDMHEARYEVAKVESEHGRPDVALDHLRRIASKVPETASWRADFFFLLADAERLKGNRSAALSSYKKYLDIAPADAPARPEAERLVQWGW